MRQLDQRASAWPALGHSWESLRGVVPELHHNMGTSWKPRTDISVPPWYTSISHTTTLVYHFTIKHRHSRRHSPKAPSIIAQQKFWDASSRYKDVLATVLGTNSCLDHWMLSLMEEIKLTRWPTLWLASSALSSRCFPDCYSLGSHFLYQDQTLG